MPERLLWNLNDFYTKIYLINEFVGNLFRLLLRLFIRKTVVAKQTKNGDKWNRCTCHACLYPWRHGRIMHRSRTLPTKFWNFVLLEKIFVSLSTTHDFVKLWRLITKNVKPWSTNGDCYWPQIFEIYHHEKIHRNLSKITTCKWFQFLNHLSVL